MKPLFTCLLFSFLLLFAHQSLSQTDLFVSVDGVGGGVSPPPTANVLYEVVINFDDLKNVPESLTLSLPDSLPSTVPVMSFNPRAGFLFRDEETDPPGTPGFWPNPNAQPEDFSYLLAGSNDDYDVVITVLNGQLVGKIYGSEKSYGIGRLADDITYWMFDIRYEGFPPMDFVEDDNSLTAASNPGNDNSSISHLKHYNLESSFSKNRGSTSTVVDVLVMWTEQARIDAGGAPLDPNDTQGIDLLIQASIDNSNEAFSNSLINTRITKFHTAKVIGFEANAGNAFTSRNIFRQLSSVNELRDLVGADVVSGVVKNGVFQGDFPACGVAYVQTHPGCGDATPVPGCSDGIGFDDYAYNLVAQNCAIFDDSFAHELGHLFGGNHARFQAPGQFPYTGYDTDVINNGYPDPFAHRVSGVFNTLMSIDSNPPRRLNFSNPNVSVNGSATGTLGTRNNARIIDLLSPTMSNYRVRQDLIFENGFE